MKTWSVDVSITANVTMTVEAETEEEAREKAEEDFSTFDIEDYDLDIEDLWLVDEDKPCIEFLALPDISFHRSMASHLGNATRGFWEPRPRKACGGRRTSDGGNLP